MSHDEQGETQEFLYNLLQLFEHFLFWADRDAGGSQAVIEGWPIWLVNALIDFDRRPGLSLRAGELLCELLTTVPPAVLVFEHDPQTIKALVVFYQQLAQQQLHGGDSVKDATALLIDLLAILLLSAHCRAHFLAASGISVALEAAAQRGASQREGAIRLLSFAVVDGEGAEGLLATAGASSFILSHLALPSKHETQVTPPPTSSSSMSWAEEGLRVLCVQEHLLSITLVLLRERVTLSSPRGDQLVAQFWESDQEGGVRVIDRLLQGLSQLHARLEQSSHQLSETASVLESCQNLIILIVAHLVEREQTATPTKDHRQRPSMLMVSLLGKNQHLAELVKDCLDRYAESCENVEYRERVERIRHSLSLLF